MAVKKSAMTGRAYGAAFLALCLLFVWLTYAVFTKRFSDYDEVTLRSSKIGLSLPVRADVKIRGVLVGEVLDLVTELKRQGSTILMTTHEMHFARNVADRIVFLHRGEVVEQGTPAEVLDAPGHPALVEFLARVHA